MRLMEVGGAGVVGGAGGVVLCAGNKDTHSRINTLVMFYVSDVHL